MKLNHPQKRFFLAITLGTAFWFLCAYFASGNMGPWFWWSPMMWNIVTSRMLTGIMIWCVWVYKRHPVLWFKINAVSRWAIVWAITSIPLAIGWMISPVEWMSAVNIFWASLIMWVIYGIIIDLVATRWGWEGKKLLEDLKS
jgi:hypothetical protein